VEDRYAYYPGCLASLSQKELDSSTRAIAQKLQVELVDMPSITCCGAGDIHEAKPDYYLHLSARILGQAERTGASTLLTICNVCTLNLRQANERLREHPDELARVNDNLTQVGIAGYEGGVDVRHLLWEVSAGDGYERFKQVAERPLEGLKVAPFYGCQILRPSKILGFEDADRPESLERLITACGAEPIDYPAKVKCCGFPIVLAREDVAVSELVQPLQEATDRGADVMVTPCPLCHLSLDAWQRKAETRAGQEFRLPILHLAQLLGAAAGVEESALKFRRHIVHVSDDVKEKLRLPSVIGKP
jgi:succinate dehydrogenase / fumarate reductase cytochrome b subunit